MCSLELVTAGSFTHTSEHLFHCPDPEDTAAFKGQDQECSCACCDLSAIDCSFPPVPGVSHMASLRSTTFPQGEQMLPVTRCGQAQCLMKGGSPGHGNFTGAFRSQPRTLSPSLFTNDQLWVCSRPDGQCPGICRFCR